MTALNRYQRLEAEGVWRGDPSARRQEVIVILGDATLVIRDRGDRPLAHWSLPAVERLGQDTPARYAPGAAAAEELEIADPEMVAAIETIRAAVIRRQARPGRLRSTLFGLMLLAVVAAAAVWLPEAVIRHAARVVPAEARTAIGERMLGHVTRLTGAPCATASAHAPLARLDRRVRGPASGRLAIVPGGAVDALHLPGGLLVLRRTVVEDHDRPAVPAGYIVAEAAAADAIDPLLAMLETAGPVVAFRLLTTGQVDEAVLAAEAERLAAGARVDPPPAALVAAFEAARIPATPYAYARDVTGEATLWLIEADRVRPAEVPPILTDGDWVALQGVCGG